MTDDKIREAIRVGEEEYTLHYKGVTKEHATEDFLIIGKSLRVLLNLAKAYSAVGEDIPKELGYATTRQLLAEITARIEMSGEMDYRTVDE